MALFLRRPKPFPIALTLLAVVVTTALGVWQLQRRDWKHDLIEKIETRASAPPVALPASIDDPDDWDYRRVTVTGRYQHDKESFMSAQAPTSQFGYQVFTPMVRDDGQTVMISRGWIPYQADKPEAREGVRPEGEVTITGLARKPWQQTAVARQFLPELEEGSNIFFEPLINEMSEIHGIGEILPVYVDVFETSAENTFPKTGQTVLKLRDPHLMYALTWFGIALAGIGVFVVYHRRPEDE